jgi:peroxiredoxin
MRAAAISLLLAATIAPSADAPKSDLAQSGAAKSSVAELLAEHDRELVAKLREYIVAHPKAADLDQAFNAIFERAIDRDWFAETESLAIECLNATPPSAAAQLARIVVVMANAKRGDFGPALVRFRELMNQLGGDDQLDFARGFADQLATEAAAAGAATHARQVYQTLLDRFGASPGVRERVESELARLDLIGRDAPDMEVRDIDGRTMRLSDARGKLVLVDVWATWCEPCLAELPKLVALEATYRERGLVIVGISLDDDAEALRAFVKDRAIPWRQLHQGSCADLIESLRVNNLPARYIVDANGKFERLDLRGDALEKYIAGSFAAKSDQSEAKSATGSHR